MKDIDKLIHSIGIDDKSASAGIFNDIMNDRIATAIDTKRVDIAGSIYNKDSVDEDIQETDGGAERT